MSQQTIERLVTALLAAVIAVVWLAPASAQAPTAAKTTSPGTTKTWSPPRTPWGDPDLQGIWTNISEANTPLNRPEELAVRNVTDPKSPEVLKQEVEETPAAAAERLRIRDLQGTEAPRRPTGGGPAHWYETENSQHPPSRLWLVTDPPDFKVPPLTSEAQKRLAARRKLREATFTSDEPLPGGWLDDIDPWVRCITRGLPEMYKPVAYNANYQIVQGPGYVTILHEMIHETRIIPLDGRPHLPPNIRQWLGDSRGRWEGNTLVVAWTVEYFTPHVLADPIPMRRGSLTERTVKCSRPGWAPLEQDADRRQNRLDIHVSREREIVQLSCGGLQRGIS